MASSAPGAGASSSENSSAKRSLDGAALANSPKRAKCEQSQTHIVSLLGLVRGKRLQVLWDVLPPDPHEAEDAAGATEPEQAEEENKTSIWWGCEFIGPTGTQHTLTDEEGELTQAVFKVRYDAQPALGFTETSVSEVIFTSDHMIFDLGFDGVLWWRADGASWEPEHAMPGTPPPTNLSASQNNGAKAAEADGEDATAACGTMANEAPAEVTVACSRSGIAAVVDSIVQQAFAKHESLIEKLPADAQYAAIDKVLAGKRMFTDALVARVEAKRSEGAGRGQPTVTREDVREAFDVVARRMEAAGTAEVLGPLARSASSR